MFESTRSASRACRVGLIVATAAAIAAASSISPAAAQVPAGAQPAEVVSRHPETGGPMAGGAVEPSISALGNIVAFEAGFTAGTRDQPMFRDRPAGFTGQANPLLGQNVTISDDGCVIAYSLTTGLYGYDNELRAYSRCTGASVLLDTFNLYVTASIPAPGVSQDGSVIAFARPRYEYGDTWDIHVYRNGKLETVVTPPGNQTKISELSISDDGTVIAFAAFDDSPYSRDVWMYDTSAPGLTLLSVGSGGVASGFGSGASVSGDGSLIAFRISGTVNVHDRALSVNRPMSVRGYAPSISRDGRHIAFVIEEDCESAHVYIARSGDRWASHSQPELINYLLPTITSDPCHDAYQPVVSEHGRWVAFWSDNSHFYAEDPQFGPNDPVQVLVRELRPALTVSSIDFGPVSGPVTRQATVQNVGPSGWRVTSIAASGGAFAVTGENCPAVLHPAESCTVSVRYTPTGEGQQTGQVIVSDDSYPGIPLQASGRLVGVSDPAEPPPDPEPVPTGLDVTPDPVVFGEAVVGTPDPSQVATVVNTGEIPVTVNSLTVSGAHAADFSVLADGCSGDMLQVDASCEVEIGFVPSDAGGRTATLSVVGSGGATASTALEGAGRFDVRLTVSPEVVSGGQAVVVSGSGFPASEEIGVTLAGSSVAVTSDGNGQFSLGWLVLSGLPQGELLADDVAVAGRYDAEPAPLIVVGTPVRPQAAATLSRTGRRLVSR